MSAPKVTVPVEPAVEVLFNLATLIRLETHTGKTPIAMVNEIAARSNVLPASLANAKKEEIAAWLDTDEGRAACAKTVEALSPREVVDFIAVCSKLSPDDVAERLPLNLAYSAYTELQQALVKATTQLVLAKDDEPTQPPPSAG
ncbi:MAG: hypothetical protein IT435_05630 [Phycisphaerales bacterium]|nr:hypothetical protein [Phycisphaerales bacterium]